MLRIEDLIPAAHVRGVTGSSTATINAVEWFADQGATVFFTDERGRPDQAVLYRDDEDRLEVEDKSRPWAFGGDGELLRLVSEAQRINLAWLFDPYGAVSSSSVEQLPHQDSAVCEEMLSRQPLRFLLADDPARARR